jgi:hypothetical protein
VAQHTPLSFRTSELNIHPDHEISKLAAEAAAKVPLEGRSSGRGRSGPYDPKVSKHNLLR